MPHRSKAKAGTGAGAGAGAGAGGATAPPSVAVSYGVGADVWVSDDHAGWLAARVSAVMPAGGVRVEVVGTGEIVDVAGEGGGSGRGRRAAAVRRLLPRAEVEGSRGAANMDDMVHLHEASVLHNLEFRFAKDLIYTSVGPILIALNPYKALPIYTDHIVAGYRSQPVDMLPPHCFATADTAFEAVVDGKGDQSLVICGESGAGKTETTKLMLKYLSQVASSDEARSVGGAAVPIQAQIMQSNPLMEAFGNAKTLRNDNSSRFGKFIRVQFGDSNTIVGATITNYLLEKPRIVTQPSDERNYHVFYQLLRGLPDVDRAAVGLRPLPHDDVASFYYLNQSGCDSLDGVDDAEELEITCRAMDMVGMEPGEKFSVLRILTGILHLGNISFAGGDKSRVAPGESAAAFARACACFQVAAKPLEKSLVVRRIESRGEVFFSPMTQHESTHARDAAAKAVYGRMFDWLVKRINRSIANKTSSVRAFIGILDIFGFEDLAENGFEQLFINYANEKLQNMFNAHVFETLQEEYRREQVVCDITDCPDNKACLQLVERSKMGILSLMDEECRLGASGTDSGVVRKMHRAHGGHPNYEKCGPATRWRGSEEDFVIHHYAGAIRYSSQGFVDRNNDTVFAPIQEAMASSSIQLLAGLFPKQRKASGGKKQITVASMFKKQLAELMKTMGSTSPQFVRCIKTTPEKLPDRFDGMSVLRQLVYAGVIDALRVRRSGFPNTLLYRDFCLRFKYLLPLSDRAVVRATDPHYRHSSGGGGGGGGGRTGARASEVLGSFASGFGDARVSIGGGSGRATRGSVRLSDDNWRAYIKTVFSHPAVSSVVGSEQYQVGVTKVFLRAGVMHAMEQAQLKLQHEATIRIQAAVRRMLCRNRFMRMCESAVKLHALARGIITRYRFDKLIEKRRREVKLAAMHRKFAASKAATAACTDGGRSVVADARQHLAKLVEARDDFGNPVVPTAEDGSPLPLTGTGSDGDDVPVPKCLVQLTTPDAYARLAALHRRLHDAMASAVARVAEEEAERARDAAVDSTLLAEDPVEVQARFSAEVLRRQRRVEAVTTATAQVEAARRELAAAVQAESARRTARANELAVAARAAEAAERQAMFEAEQASRAYTAALAKHMQAVAQRELAAMLAEERWQRELLHRRLRWERGHEAQELAAMRRVEQRQRVVDAAIRRAERAREGMERDGMASEEKRQRAYEDALVALEREYEAAERDAMAREEQQQLAFERQLKKMELDVEARERNAMRAEEVRQLLVYREVRRLELLRQTRELLSMRMSEQQQRRVMRDIAARERLDALREAQRQRRAEAAELIAMRREEEYLRYVQAELRRQAYIIQQRVRSEEARRQARERERMGFEESLQRRVAHEMRRLLLESFEQWAAEEQRREVMARNAMEVADNFSHHMRSYDKARAAEAAAQEMEGICMAAEDARSRSVHLMEAADRRSVRMKREARFNAVVQRQENFDTVRLIRRAAAASAAVTAHLGVLQTAQLALQNAAAARAKGSGSAAAGDESPAGSGTDGGSGGGNSEAVPGGAPGGVDDGATAGVGESKGDAAADSVAGEAGDSSNNEARPPNAGSVIGAAGAGAGAASTEGGSVAGDGGDGGTAQAPAPTGATQVPASPPAVPVVLPRVRHFRSLQRQPGFTPSPGQAMTPESRAQAQAAAQERRWLEVEDRRSHALIHAQWLRDQYHRRMLIPTAERLVDGLSPSRAASSISLRQAIEAAKQAPLEVRVAHALDLATRATKWGVDHADAAITAASRTRAVNASPMGGATAGSPGASRGGGGAGGGSGPTAGGATKVLFASSTALLLPPPPPQHRGVDTSARSDAAPPHAPSQREPGRGGGRRRQGSDGDGASVSGSASVHSDGGGSISRRGGGGGGGGGGATARGRHGKRGPVPSPSVAGAASSVRGDGSSGMGGGDGASVDHGGVADGGSMASRIARLHRHAKRLPSDWCQRSRRVRDVPPAMRR